MSEEVLERDDDEEGGGGPRLHVTVEEKLDIARDVAGKLFSLLGGAQPGLDVRAEDEQVVVALQGLDPRLCPPGDTRVLESVQFILNKAINRFALKRTRLSIDAEGFRRRRPEGLDKVAQALAKKAQALGKPIAVGPLGQGDLRFLSAQLNREQGVHIQALGQGDRRRLLIQPIVEDAGEDGELAEGQAQGAGGQGRRRRRRRR